MMNAIRPRGLRRHESLALLARDNPIVSVILTLQERDNLTDESTFLLMVEQLAKTLADTQKQMMDLVGLRPAPVVIYYEKHDA